MNQQITIKVNSTFKYLQLWNGIFKLTDTELRVLSTLIESSKFGDAPNLCSSENKKIAARALAINDFNKLNNYVKKFKDKKAIRKEGKNYKLNTLLNTDTKSVKIDIDWNE